MLKEIFERLKASYILGYYHAIGKQRMVPVWAEFEYDGVYSKVAIDDLFIAAACFNFSAIQMQNDEFCIYVNKDFLEADSSVQGFLLTHEIGHYKKGHLATKKSGLLNTIVRSFKADLTKGIDHHEFEADMYAVEHIGFDKCIDALKYMLEKKPKNKELIKRIELLQEIKSRELGQEA